MTEHLTGAAFRSGHANRVTVDAMLAVLVAGGARPVERPDAVPCTRR